ncbi:hypothetical protein SMICM304S_09438 [Streptomyces microflavus]
MAAVVAEGPPAEATSRVSVRRAGSTTRAASVRRSSSRSRASARSATGVTWRGSPGSASSRATISRSTAGGATRVMGTLCGSGAWKAPM